MGSYDLRMDPFTRTKGAVLLLAGVLVGLAAPTFAQRPAVDVADGRCDREVLISVVDDARIYASCSTDANGLVMHVSVTNLAGPDVGPLSGVSIGFCGGSVISASAPPGWITSVKQGNEEDVDWDMPQNRAQEWGIPPGARMGGFVVRLKPGAVGGVRVRNLDLHHPRVLNRA